MDHDHLPALSALLFAAPVAVLALAGAQLAAAGGLRPARLALARTNAAPPTVRAAALLLMAAGAIHLGLVPGHLGEPLLAASFVGAGVALVGLAAAALVELRYWRPLAAGTLLAVLGAYAATRIAGAEGVDVLGVATAALEIGALVLLREHRLTTA